jgi:hypothetical protein
MIDKKENRTQNRDANVRGDQTGSVQNRENDSTKKHGDPMAGDAMQGREKRKTDEQSKPK